MPNNCSSCRYWSEMLAQSIGVGPVEAMCLDAESPNRGLYIAGSSHCSRWKHNELGAVDNPAFLRSGEDADAAYSEYDERGAS